MRLARLALLLIVLLLVSCTRVTEEKLATGVLYQDDFSTDMENWVLESDLDANANYVDGQLQLEITFPNLIAWAELVDHKFDDFVLEVDATQLGGPDDNSYGIIFRMKNPSTYYRFDISGDGHYLVIRRDEEGGGQWIAITGDWLPSEAIHKGASTNKIKIVAQGSHFTFYVNGQQVAEANDDTYRSGTVGLNAGSFHESGVKIGFDNLTIKRPE